MCLIGAVPWLRGLFIFIAQIIGGICAAAVVSALFPGPLSVATTLAGGTNIAQGLFIEMFLTAELVFTIFMLAAEKHKGTFIAPVGIGLALFIAELTGNGLFTIAHFQNTLTIVFRCFLHGRLAKPGKVIWTMRSHQKLSWVPLDLLAGTSARFSHCGWLL